jgi:glucose/arabinose dehydrogenase
MKIITKLIYAALAVVSLAIGGVTAQGALNDLFASINGTADNGGGFIYEYTPSGVQSTFASGLSRPRGVAIDSAGNLLVAVNDWDGSPNCCQGTILKILPDGTQTTFADVTAPSGYVFLEGLAIDGAGNVFVVSLNQNPVVGVTIYKFTPGGAQSTFASLPSIQTFGITFDSAGFLYAAQNFETGRPQIWKFAPDGTSILVATASRSDIGLVDLAFDRFGNLFVSAGPFAPGQDLILKYAPDGTESTFATGLYAVRGLAFDRAGNLFVAEIIPNGPGDIIKITASGNQSVFASGIGGANGGPEFLATQPVTQRPRPTPPPRPPR